MEKLVSIIMAEYNTNLEQLKISVESILNQTYKNIELIIVNDCTVVSNQIYLNDKAKVDNRIKIINNENNLGLAKSLNKAIDQSNGEVIFRMDSDDISLKNRIESQMKLIEKGKSIVSSRAILIDEEENQIGKTKKIIFHNFFRRILLYKFFLNSVIHPSIAAKREVFEEYKYNENVKYAQDYELWLRMYPQYKIYFDSSLLIKYRISKKYNKEKHIQQLKTHINFSELYVNRLEKNKITFKIIKMKYKKKIDEIIKS